MRDVSEMLAKVDMLYRLKGKRLDTKEINSLINALFNRNNLKVHNDVDLISDEDFRLSLDLNYNGYDYYITIWYLKTREKGKKYITEVSVETEYYGYEEE